MLRGCTVPKQTGNYPNKWFNTAVVTGVLPNMQYHDIVDESRRVSLRNRRFLKKILPVSGKGVEPTPEIATLPAEVSVQPILKPTDTVVAYNRISYGVTFFHANVIIITDEGLQFHLQASYYLFIMISA